MTAMKKEKSLPLVCVEWVDSRQPTSSWAWVDEYEPQGACSCVSVGFLLKDGKDVKVLAPNLADIFHEKQATGIINIPVACITRLTTLSGYRRFLSGR